MVSLVFYGFLWFNLYFDGFSQFFAKNMKKPMEITNFGMVMLGVWIKLVL